MRRAVADARLVSYRAALVLLGKMTSVEYAQAVYENLSMDRLGTWDDIQASILKADDA